MMAILDHLAEQPWTEVAGWTLVHFLWQGAVLAAFAAVLLNLLQRSSPSCRYTVACGCLVLMAAAPAGTAIRLAWQTDLTPTNPAAENQLDSVRPSSPTIGQSTSSQVDLSTSGAGSGQTSAAAGSLNPTQPTDQAALAPAAWQTFWRDQLSRSFPAGVAAWLAGVLLLSLRLGGGLWRVRQWRRRSVVLQSPEWSGLTARLAARMGLKGRFQLMQSAEAVVPAVIGWLKPVVIVPTSLLSGLTTAELESLLAHELAHIRRHDYLVNLLQSVIETLLFYHPAVWWLSGVIRTEREHCCDDLAVAACGDRMVFVRALTRMEELRCDEPGLALSARGGSLLERIRRLVVPNAARPVSWPTGIASIVCGLSALAGIAVAALADDSSGESRGNQVAFKSPTNSTENDSGSESLKSVEPSGFQSPDGFRVIKREEDRITLATMESRPEGRSPAELLKRFAEAMARTGSPPQAGAWVTDQETLVSAENPSYVLPGPKPDMVVLDAPSILFNLPEGAGLRAELSGEKIELTQDDSHTTAVVTNGRAKLIDSQGIVRAEASPDGGAEQLVVEVRESNGETVLQLQTRRIEPSPNYPQPPVQMKCNLATGAPADEEQPPHGAVRFRFENPMGGEPARMKIVWHYDLQRLSVEAQEQTDAGTFPDGLAQPVPPRATPDDTDWVATARGLGNWLEAGSGDGFDARGYLQLAAGLRALPETERIEVLRSIASARLEGQTIALCRMLFQAREGADLRRPALGKPHFVGTESSAQSWPLEPIALIEDVPLLIVEGYALAGQAEPASEYLEWCLANCRWTDRSFVLNEQALANAEQTIRQAEFWQGGIDMDEWRELGLLLKQLRPGFMIHVQQQSWVNQVMPSWMLDFQTRVTPETLVEELRKRGGTPEARMILILSDNATVEWIEQILQPLLTAGYQQVELIRWQQSPEPARIPELQQMLSASRPAAADGEPEWGAIARDSGLQSRLSLQTKSPTVGQPLLFRLELRNTGDQPTRFDPQDYAPFRVLRALGADGQAVSFIGSTPQTAAQPVTLQPGETTVLWQDVDASALFALKEGKHQFFAEGGDWAAQMWWQDSNTVDVELGAGQLPPKQALTRSLAEFELLPEGWQVSATQDEILLSHSPANLKRDVTTIRLWFTDDPLPDRAAADHDNGREAVTTLAVTTAGHLHVAAPPQATELWPEYVRDIRIAASRVLVFRTDPPPRQQNGDHGSEPEDRPAADKL